MLEPTNSRKEKILLKIAVNNSVKNKTKVICLTDNKRQEIQRANQNIKAHLTPKFLGFKNWQKVAEFCYQLVHDRVSRGLALFLIWRHRLIYMTLTLCEHACKTVWDVKIRIDPCPSPARSWDKEYQISGCTVARKNFRCCEKMLSRFWNSFKFVFLRK